MRVLGFSCPLITQPISYHITIVLTIVVIWFHGFDFTENY